MFMNPRDRLKSEEVVRYANTPENTILWAAEDLIKTFCEQDETEKLLHDLERKRGIFRKLTIVRVMLDDEDWDEEDQYLSIRDEDLLSFLSKLPGRRAAKFKKELIGYEVMEESRRAFIIKRSDHWTAVGELFKMTRQALGVSQAKTARGLRVSSSTLSSFEAGMPVSRAKLIQRACEMSLELRSFHVPAAECRKRLEDLNEAHLKLHAVLLLSDSKVEAIDQRVDELENAVYGDDDDGEGETYFSEIDDLLKARKDLADLAAVAHRLMSSVRCAIHKALQLEGEYVPETEVEELYQLFC